MIPGPTGPWLARRAALLGDPGRAWLAGLAEVVAALTRRWDLTVEEPLAGGTSAWVARVRRADGTAAVLKVAIPNAASVREAAVLSAAGGRGYVRVLASAPEHRAVLLEALGEPLSRSGLPPGRQLAVVCDLLREAWRPPDGPAYPKAQELAELVARVWEELDRPCPAAVVDRALDCARRRAADTDRLVVVHGDPHPGNALERPDGSFAFVDPAAFVADPAYDLGVALRDWCPELLAGDAPALAARYARVLADRSGMPLAAVVEWGFLERVSTGLYVLEHGAADVAEPFLRTAALLARAR